MLILIDDKVQSSDAPAALKSSALSDTYEDSTSIAINLDAFYDINCIGFGYTDATEVTVSAIGLSETITVNGNGLYVLPETNNQVFTISHDGSYIGRVALGFSRSLGVAPTREAGFYTTHSPRTTLSGQIVESAGGYNGRRIAVDFRYKITEDMFNDFQAAFTYIAKGLPYFLKFTDKELVRMPFERLYASPTDNNLLFQSSVNRFLYSYQFDFYERF
jgi:hypothetical protein